MAIDTGFDLNVAFGRCNINMSVWSIMDSGGKLRYCPVNQLVILPVLSAPSDSCGGGSYRRVCVSVLRLAAPAPAPAPAPPPG